MPCTSGRSAWTWTFAFIVNFEVRSVDSFQYVKTLMKQKVLLLTEILNKSIQSLIIVFLHKSCLIDYCWSQDRFFQIKFSFPDPFFAALHQIQTTLSCIRSSSKSPQIVAMKK